MTTPKIMSESREQILFVNWMRKTHPEHWIFAIPNGGARGMVQAQVLKMEGVSKGVPDLFIPSLKLWIEMKKKDGGILSKEQKEWIKYLQDNDYIAVVAHGFEEAKDVVSKII